MQTKRREKLVEIWRRMKHKHHHDRGGTHKIEISVTLNHCTQAGQMHIEAWDCFCQGAFA